ncbi:MAG: DUF389 domain-containing protein [Anaerolineaceae bacterium]|nr:DUF389 domain-containing protein [Anaerolineaceae bacterium]
MATNSSSDNTQIKDFQSGQSRLSQKPFLGFMKTIKNYFKEQKLTETRKAIVLNDLVDAGSPGTDFFIMILFSSAIATFGLVADLSVVTIGAQLIDPIMSPILGLAIASLSGLSRMFKRSFIAIIKGAGAAVGISTVISFLAYRVPYSIQASIPHEVMVRTTASPFDLGIAIVGGSAAAYALAHPRLNTALPGVAIATALMPPLCTIGFGIAFQSAFIILGAVLLFLTNFVAITFSAIIMFALLGFGLNKIERNNHLSRSVMISALMMLIIAIPLAILAWNTISAARLDNRASSIIMNNLPDSVQPQLVDLTIKPIGDKKDLTVTLRMVRELTSSEMILLHNRIADQLGESITLQIVTLPMQIIE